ncbi:3-hydroxybutyryl-CoA dehydrogenase [Evansella cellulosilytica]|uniref:3-hydroxyacyl-CoA dehydrogenase NAD-binding protein n=1 Tax=Evansella cellulosilytica (strain ATCC 21833 / DSM 2522 / FERM P-1141 / JCM 9156 / N-4) TaxID=649639 RepID=E6TXE9_EVAC2|nr:3-hydroxybutyryl-CoA dehydrogenase [Evansella cellulosilytica]ADU32344.1 3-hydroxyacyl-CoA dehydrogenase NAD-binding protein [Evansella cellulosilytica DSM 2522]
MEIKRVMVVGAGQMGAGIAQICARNGYEVILHDLQEDIVEKGISSIRTDLHRQVKKERLSDADVERILRLIQMSTQLGNVEHVDMVIEAATEKLETKKTLFSHLDRRAPEHVILATNTSSLPITEIAAETKRPDKVIGMHFMNPVPIMKLIEVIKGLATSDETLHAVKAMAKSLKKTAVEVNDYPGFVANRILMPMINEAIFTVYEGVSTPENVDEVMKLGMNHPMGPLTLADFIGLDTCLYIMETLHEGFGDDKYRPCPLLRKYVKAGWLGKKSGRGFYTYEA